MQKNVSLASRALGFGQWVGNDKKHGDIKKLTDTWTPFTSLTPLALGIGLILCPLQSMAASITADEADFVAGTLENLAVDDAINGINIFVEADTGELLGDIDVNEGNATADNITSFGTIGAASDGTASTINLWDGGDEVWLMPGSTTTQSTIDLGDGANTVTVSGAVTNSTITGGADVDIITFQSGANVSGTTVSTGLGDDIVTIESGATIDTATSFDGGAGTDIINFPEDMEISTLSNWETVRISAADSTANIALNITDNFTNAGTIDMTQNQTAGDTMTVGGDFNGNGGSLLMDVNVQTLSADKLVVNGNVTGTTVITVNALGTANPSATDTNSDGVMDVGEGIKLIDVTGATAASDDAFSATTVNAGAYAYDLTRSSVDGDWYFFAPRDTSTTLSTGASSSLGLATSLFGLSGDTSSASASLSGGTSLTGGLATVGGVTSVGNLHDRIKLNNCPVKIKNNFSYSWSRNYRQCTDGSNKHRTVSWVALLGGQSEDENGGEVTSTGLRFGTDFLVYQNKLAALYVGAKGIYGKSDKDIISTTSKDSFDSETLGGGITATWYNGSDYYVDLQAQMVETKTDIVNNLVGDIAKDLQATSTSYSLEFGKRFLFISANKRRIGLTPQAQIIYDNKEIDDFVSYDGNKVVFEDVGTVTTRLGLLTEYTTASPVLMGSRSTFYSIANMYHVDYQDKIKMNYAGTSLTFATDSVNIGELGIGTRYIWGERYAMYADVSYMVDIDNASDTNSVRAGAGFQMKW
jgi:outer membrane autotransporter protein